MDSWKDSAIWKLIRSVERGEIEKAETLCNAANQECDDLYEKINIQDRKTVENLKQFISSVQKGQRRSINSQLESSKKDFESFVVPYLQEIKRAEEKKPASKPVIPKAQRNAEKKEHLTGTALKFRSIFDEQWPDVLESLMKRGLPEKTAEDILLEIVQRAFTFNKEEEERQLREAQRCTYHIVKCGEIPKEIPRTTPYDSSHVADELRQYRYLLADKAVPRAQTEFLSKILQQVYKKYSEYGIKNCKEIGNYASLCVEVTWFMCAEDPPIHMVFWKESDPFDEELYTPSTRKGTKIDYVLWPALQRYKNGPVLVKGIVECKK